MMSANKPSANKPRAEKRRKTTPTTTSKKVEKKKQVVDVQSLKSTLEQKKREQREMCNREISEILRKHNCLLIPRILIIGGQVQSHDFVVMSKK
jgi:hypothetical protein